MNGKNGSKNMNPGIDGGGFKEMCCHGDSKKALISIFVLILCVFFVVLTISTFFGALNKIKEGKDLGKTRESISVSGTGEVYTKPDLAVINISVVTEKKTVDEAVSENTNKMNSIIEAIKSQGVDGKDLKTTTFSVNPRYEYTKEISATSSGVMLVPQTSSERRILAGYEVSQSLEVKIRDLGKVGAITESATSAGANDIGNLYFTVENKEQAENQAREEAIKKAKEKAASLAFQLGIKLTKIVNFYENNYYYPVEKSMDVTGMGIGGGEASVIPTPNIQTGENKITINVNIVYEIE